MSQPDFLICLNCESPCYVFEWGDEGCEEALCQVCGNDEAAKSTVGGILDQFGWETADMGRAEAARAIEPLCMLWCIPGFLRNDWVHAFKLLA